MTPEAEAAVRVDAAASPRGADLLGITCLSIIAIVMTAWITSLVWLALTLVSWLAS